MDFINLLGSVWPEGNLWASIIKLFDVGSYAWTIILFTIILKLVLSPIDFGQRFFTNKQARAQAKLQPELEKLKKRYGQNQTLLYQKQNELYKKNNVKMSGSCIIMIVYMAVTLTVFLTLFNSLQSISGFKIKNQYQELQQVYYNSFNADYAEHLEILDEYNLATTKEEKLELLTNAETEKYNKILETLTNGTETEEELKEKQATAKSQVDSDRKIYEEKAQKEVQIKYAEIKDSWLWVKSIWRADKATVKEIPSFKDFESSAGKDITTEAEYNLVMGELLKEENNKTNGYYILSVIVVLVSLLSQFVIRQVSRPKSKTGETIKTPQPGLAKAMIFIMPITMLIFTLSSSSIFSIYIITNSLTTAIITPIITIICNKIEDKQEEKKKEEIKVDYRR